MQPAAQSCRAADGFGIGGGSGLHNAKAHLKRVSDEWWDVVCDAEGRAGDGSASRRMGSFAAAPLVPPRMSRSGGGKFPAHKSFLHQHPDEDVHSLRHASGCYRSQVVHAMRSLSAKTAQLRQAGGHCQLVIQCDTAGAAPAAGHGPDCRMVSEAL